MPVTQKLTLEQAHAMQDELIEGFADKEFQKKLHALWFLHDEDQLTQMKVRAELCFEVQGPILAKYGFEQSRKGLAQSKRCFDLAPLKDDQPLFKKSAALIHLCSPELQAAEVDWDNVDAVRESFHMGRAQDKIASQKAPARQSAPESELDAPVDASKPAKSSRLAPDASKPAKPSRPAPEHVKEKEKFILRFNLGPPDDPSWPAARTETALRLREPTGQAPEDEKFVPFIPMTKKEARMMQEDLIEGFSKEAIQTKLHGAWKWRGTQKEFMARRREILLEVQKPIMKKYGYEESFSGVLASLRDMTTEELNVDKDIQDANHMIHILTTPEVQERIEKMSHCTIKVYSEDRSRLCEVRFHESSTVRLVKEKIEKSTGIWRQAQKLMVPSVPEVGYVSDTIGELHDMELIGTFVKAGEEVDLLLERRPTQVTNWLRSLSTEKKVDFWRWDDMKKAQQVVAEVIGKLPEEAFLNDEFMIPAIQESRAAQISLFAKMPPSVSANLKVMASAVGYAGTCLENAAPSLQADEKFVHAAVELDGWALQHASPEIKKKRRIVLAAIENDGFSFQYAAPELQLDFEVCCAAVQVDGWVIRKMPPARAEDRKIVLLALTTSPNVIHVIKPSLWQDREIVLTTVKRYGHGLEVADPVLRNDREVVQVAVAHTGAAVRWASENLRDDKEVGMMAVRRDGIALSVLGPSCLEDVEICAAAVKQTFAAFMYVPTSIKSKVAHAIGLKVAFGDTNWDDFEKTFHQGRRPQTAGSADDEPELVIRRSDLKVHLKTLGLPESERDGKVITRHYRRLALLHHPDKNPDDPEGARNRMTSINHAYQQVRKELNL